MDKRKIEWTLISEELKQWLFSAWIIFPFLVLFGIAMYWGMKPDIEKAVSKEILTGNLVGIHQIQDYTGSTQSKFVTQLDNGEKIQVKPENTTPYIKNRKVRITKVTTEHDRIYYQFHSYLPHKDNN